MASSPKLLKHFFHVTFEEKERHSAITQVIISIQTATTLSGKYVSGIHLPHDIIDYLNQSFADLPLLHSTLKRSVGRPCQRKNKVAHQRNGVLDVFLWRSSEKKNDKKDLSVNNEKFCTYVRAVISA